ncbi:hypothetical protein N7516_009766 [Penicillium verrucosum]|uniref:uncharacterized protein n=1 Tax=Penicillium verrucosum TaxID=60171 RepID=UPI0025450142|nr:uncharacterized protein N7516_009766 [Penicillium verrucosum]KAJ5922063.1 hypothetical protein N7516_009766 [Penicillium verrucosum]
MIDRFRSPFEVSWAFDTVNSISCARLVKLDIIRKGIYVATIIPAPEVRTETQQNIATLQSFYNLARLEAAQSFPVLMTAASRLEALAASCAASKKALQFLRLAGENRMTDTDAATLLQRTTQQILPTYINDKLSSMATETDAAHIRDAIHFAQSLPIFSAAVSSDESDSPAIDIFRRLRNEWAKLLPARTETKLN